MYTFHPSGYLYSPILLQHNVLHGFGTKKFDKSNLIAKYLTGHNTSLITPKQKHSTNITIATAQNAKIINTGGEYFDGIITKEKNIMLTVHTADCVPIIFFDPVKRVIGISHQGWKGSLDKLAQKMVKQMVAMGSSVSTIIALIGPCIGDCCYEVYGERKHLFEQTFSCTPIFTIHQNKTYLNLLALNYHQLVSSGLHKKNISFFPFCTSCDSARFHSYFREGENLKSQMIHFVQLI
ncbi:peptidoglycan editing factor PgeF [Candidatus Woesebacteria bacterium]|nr:peptidoglycan editing factor PgeF [Candidatus Woesebacteria bacterium]